MKLVFESKSNQIAFHTHQGFGDLITCAPIANKLALENPDKKILFIARADNYAKNLRKFCIPQVEIVVIENYPSHENAIPEKEVAIVDSWARNNNYSLIRSGFNQYWYDPTLPWDFSFYDNVGVSYEAKNSHFCIERNVELENLTRSKLGISKGDEYAFVHDDPSRGLIFTPKTQLKIIKNSKEIEIADMAVVLEEAAELHMMGSSLLCLADLMNLPNSNQKAFYYTFRGNLNIRGKERWKVV